MRSSILILLAFLSLGAAPAHSEPVRITAKWPALVDAEGMAERISTPGLRIVDLRDGKDYAEGHADGAVSVPMASWNEAERSDGLPAQMGAAGVHPDRPILLIPEGGTPDAFVDAAWLGWELRRRGVQSVTILKDGMESWTEAGLRTTGRVHRHRTYRMPFETDLAKTATQNEVAGIRLGVAEGALLEVAETGEEAPIEGVPILAMTPLLEDGALDPLTLLERLKNIPVAWQATRVVVFSEDPRLAAAFGFMAGEIAGISDIAVLPGAAGDTAIAGLE